MSSSNSQTATSGSSSGYLYDGFIEEPDKTPQEQHFENFKKFVKDYEEDLTEKEQALNDGDDAVLGKLWNAFDDCVKFKFQPQEVQTYEELLQTENRLLQKVTLTLAKLCDEMDELTRTAAEKFYPPLSIFGDSTNEQLEEGEKQLQFGRSIPLLMDLWNFCERVNTTVQNVIQELAKIYNAKNSKKQGELASYLNVHFLPVYASLSEVLGVMITLDEMIQQNQSFSHHLTLYNRMISKVMEEPERFGTDKRSAGRIHYLLQKIDGDILDDNIFKSCITRNFEDEEQGVTIQTNTTFQKEFLTNLESYFTIVSAELNTQKETDNRYKFVGLCGLYILYFTLFMDTSNKKFFKKLWIVHKDIPVIHLYGNTVWSSAEFFLNKIPDMIRLIGVKNPRKEINETRAYALKNLDAALPALVKAHDMNMAVWISRVESTFMMEKEGKDVVGIEGTLILQGIQLAYAISGVLKSAIYLHVLASKPLTVSQVILLCRCVQMLKCIQATFHRKSASFAKHVSILTEFLSFKIQKLLLPLRNRLESKKKSSDTDIDQLSATSLCLHLLSGGSPSLKRVLLVRLVLCVSLQRTTGLLQTSEFDEVRGLLRRLDVLSQFESSLKSSCDCSLLYWSRLVINTFFNNIFQHPDRAPELKQMFAALQDPQHILTSAVHLKEKMQLFDAYKTEVLNAFEHHIISPLCTEVETDLRLHIHSAVIQSNNNISKLKGNLKDMTTFFKLRPIRFFDQMIEIRRRVSQYLDKTFYDLTAITQHDHKTYEEMRNLAVEKYGLDMTNVYLPGQTLEQGLDVLEITRNINVFVTKYSYNLNNNMFIERCASTDAKNLNTIHIKHIANSIRTHGTGIMNTTVNFVFKYLGRKFYIFSQFLFDDHIKSRLIKDIRFYKEKAMELDNKYPLKQANSFVKYIKKLGTTNQGISYLDQFRELITEIGNALGYVRMVRAGGLRYISDAVKFVPDLDGIPNFEELVQLEQQEQGIAMSAETQQAAKNLYDICNNFAQKFAEGSDYFKTLETVFTKEMQKEHNSHLKNFFIIVPPLTISFVEHMLISKDKMIRSGKESNFTNDGFALGVAFILKILNQNKRFNSLHWFESVAEHYNREFDQLKKTMSEKKSSSGKNNTNVDDELQTMRLTMNRIKSYKREFELLFFSWSSSRIFFNDL